MTYIGRHPAQLQSLVDSNVLLQTGRSLEFARDRQLRWNATHNSDATCEAIPMVAVYESLLDFSELAPIVRNARESWRDSISLDPL